MSDTDFAGLPRLIDQLLAEMRELRTQHSGFVDYGTSSMDISEEKYREEAYQPPFEQLPWKGEAFATRRIRRQTQQ